MSIQNLLIYRHYVPQDGTIFLDNKNLNEYNLHALRRFIAIVPQETELFNMSAHDNIAYGNPKATKKEVEQAVTALEVLPPSKYKDALVDMAKYAIERDH